AGQRGEERPALHLRLGVRADDRIEVVVEPDGVEAEGMRLRPVSGDCRVADTLLRRLDAEAEGGGGHAWRYTIDGGATSSPNDLVDSCARFAFSECHEARDRPRDMENAEFERLVAEALDDIPAEFARLLANVTVWSRRSLRRDCSSRSGSTRRASRSMA